MPRIFLNSGHCVGVDCGAVGCGLEEADVALKISRRVESYLQAVGYEVKVFYDNYLQSICDDANFWRADLFVSIHCNSFNGKARGTEVIYNEGSEDGARLADCIRRQIVQKLGTVDRGLKTKIAGGYDAYVTKYTNMPAVLVETAFIDNPDDAALLVNREDDFARAIAVGISDYFVKPVTMPDTVDLPPKHSTALGKHFDEWEFACPHCGKCIEIHPRLIELLEKLRENIGGYPLHITSGYRCEYHNAEVGGVPDSQHLRGTAADIACPRHLKIGEFKWYCEQLPFDYIKCYRDSKFVHVDVRFGGVSQSPIVEED